MADVCFLCDQNSLQKQKTPARRSVLPASKARSDSSSSDANDDDKDLKVASQHELDYELQELLLREELPVDKTSPRRAQVPWPLNQGRF